MKISTIAIFVVALCVCTQAINFKAKHLIVQHTDTDSAVQPENFLQSGVSRKSILQGIDAFQSDEENSAAVSEKKVAFSAIMVLVEAMFPALKAKYIGQIKRCFTESEINSIDANVQEMFKLAASLKDTKQILSLPEKWSELILQKFDPNTARCVYRSHDVLALVRVLNVGSLWDVSPVYKSFAVSNSPYLSETFKSLYGFLENQDFDSFNSSSFKVLDKMFISGLSPLERDSFGAVVDNPQRANYTYYGVSVSNGLIGAVSKAEPFKLKETVLAGAYDRYGRGRVDNIVETMNLMEVDLYLNGRLFNPKSSDYQQGINYKTGVFNGSYTEGSDASVVYNYTALKNSPSTFYLEVEVTAHTELSINARNIHRVPDELNGIEKMFENVPNKEVYRVMTTKARTKVNRIQVVLSSLFIVDKQSREYLVNGWVHEDLDTEFHQQGFDAIKIPKGHVFRFVLISSLVSSQHHTDPVNEAIRLLVKAASTEHTELIQTHESLWAELWKSDITIKTIDPQDNTDQKIARSMLYHLYAFLNTHKSYGLSPMGLSGLGYNGHVFWDMDLWMYPGILALNPQLGRVLVQYRYERMEAARNNAFMNGYSGLMYPWESSKLGEEQTPVWAAPGPLEHHVTGTVAFGAWNYYRVTQDLDWLREKGSQIIEGAAQFWESRVILEDDGMYHINNVVAADEFAQNIDDDAFTNAVAKETLKIANKVRKLFSSKESAHYEQIASKLKIHVFEDTNVTREYRNYDGRAIKQADVNLLAFPLKQITDPQQILRDLEYYENRVPGGGTPAMTQAIFSLLYSRLGNSEKAYEFLEVSYLPNLLPPFNVMAETRGGDNPYFLTGAGGVIQSFVFGFGGLDITDSGLKTANSTIPDSWQSITIHGYINNTNDKHAKK